MRQNFPLCQRVWISCEIDPFERGWWIWFDFSSIFCSLDCTGSKNYGTYMYILSCEMFWPQATLKSPKKACCCCYCCYWEIMSKKCYKCIWDKKYLRTKSVPNLLQIKHIKGAKKVTGRREQKILANENCSNWTENRENRPDCWA